MEWRLGLDMGTNSIGWAALETKSGVPFDLMDLGVRIFHDGRDPKSGESLNQARRQARLMRRQRYRTQRRMKVVKNLLIRSGFFPADSTTQQEIKKMNPYNLRVKALTEKLPPFELGRVLLHLSGRRGFLSNRKSDSEEDKNLSQLKEKMKSLKEKLEDKTRYRTLGEYLWETSKTVGQGLRFRPELTNIFPLREMYLEEWETIRKEQVKFHPTLPWEELRNKTYFQRPLKPQIRGLCLFTGEPRAWNFLPTLQRFRIYQEVNALKIYTETGKEELTQTQKDLLYRLLEGKEAAKWKGKGRERTLGWPEIKKKLGISSNQTFSLENDPKRADGLQGDWISEKFRQPDFVGPQWDELSDKLQDQIVEAVASENDDDIIRGLFQTLILSEEQMGKMLDFSIANPQTASVSISFAQKVLDYLRQGQIYSTAVESAGFHHSLLTSAYGDGLGKHLPYYGEILWDQAVRRTDKKTIAPEKNDTSYMVRAIEHFGRITNPTVHIALNQLRLLVNKLIQRFGNPNEVVLEMGRDLKQTKKQKDETSKQQAANQKLNQRIKEELRHIGIAHPSSWDLKKYKLWEELGKDQAARCCLYSGKPISLRQLFSDEVEIEHILPYSRTLLDGMSNLTVSYKTANAYKGKRSPWEAFHSSPAGYSWESISDRVKRTYPGIERYNVSKRGKFTKEAMEDFDESEEFVQRQLTDNHYIAKAATRYLSVVCPRNKIWNSIGNITFAFRSTHGLNALLTRRKYDDDKDYPARKNRSDHRHHAVDAVAIALIDRSILQHVQRKSGLRELEHHDWKEILPVLPFPRKRLEEMVKNILPSIRVDREPMGQLFEETAMSKRFPPVRKKTKEITQGELPLIVSDKIREEFEEQLATLKKWSAVIGVMSDIYPEVVVKEPQWISRKPVTRFSIVIYHL